MAALRAPAPRPHAVLTRLTLTDFRSYSSAELAPDPGLTVVTGRNGAGKTNLLEAVAVAVTGRSQRAATDGELVRHGAGFARVRLEIDGGASARGGHTVEALIPGVAPPAGLRKRLTVNGMARRAGGVGEVARAVLFRPEEMLLLIGSPADRRRLLDGILAQRDRRAARDLAELARIVAQRNALLRAVRAEEADIGALGFWDEQLALVGARVMHERLAVVRELGERIGPLHDAVADPDRAEDASLRLVYLDTLKEAWRERAAASGRVPEVEELVAAFRRRIADVRQKEAWNGVSLVGPQRDDLRVELGGRDVATHASRGQQRTIILALKLAETEVLTQDGPRPLVLLDDVFSELDPSRAHRIATQLVDRGQVIVTGADLASLAPALELGAAVWDIEDGRLGPART